MENIAPGKIIQKRLHMNFFCLNVAKGANIFHEIMSPASGHED